MKPLLLICLILIASISNGKPLLLEGDLGNWKKQILTNETQYEPIMDLEQGVVIRAQSNNSASGYSFEKDINLNKTPVIQWQWAAEQTPLAEQVTQDGMTQTLSEFDETQAAGNDFALRLIVSRTGMFGAERSIHYVWSHSQPLESSWSMDADNKVLVVGGGMQSAKQWQTVFRHIQKDWETLFAEKIDEVNRIMIMTDSDQIQGKAVGYYGDMHMLAVQSLADN